MQDENKSKLKSEEKEIDLGVFYLIATRVFRLIGQFFKTIFSLSSGFIMSLLLLLKKNILFLSIAFLIGFSIGLYKSFLNGPSYFSELVVSTNFESSRLVYQKIDYFNALIKEGQMGELSKIFNIPQSEARKLVNFEIEPISDFLQGAKAYKNNFLDYHHNEVYGSDTLWTRTVEYKQFIANLTKFDYPQHKIRLYSRNASIYPKVQTGLIALIRENPAMKYAREANLSILSHEEALLNNSLKGLDSLRNAYNKKIENTSQNTNPNTNILLTQGSQKAAEIELYDKELELKDELMAIKKKHMEQSDVIMVISDFNSIGTRVPKIKEDALYYAAVGFIIMFIIIVLTRFYHFLGRFEKNLR